MTAWLLASNRRAAGRAAQLIRVGELVIMPTDTVYGVGADLWQEAAVEALYEAKGRPQDRAIPILLADPDCIGLVAQEIPENALRLAEAFWPGPLTIAVPKRRLVPDAVSSLPTVGVRVPDHDAARAVIRACGGALAVTSANRSGGPDPLTAQQAADALGEAVALVLEGGPCPGGMPSTVVDVTDDDLRIVREGPISEAQLRRALSKRRKRSR